MQDDKCVYVVDDDEFVRKSVVALVNAKGLCAREFQCAEEFLEFADSTINGCIVADIRLGGMTGLQLHRALVDKNIGTPIILITGYFDSSLQHDPLVTILEKTCSSQVLLEKILSKLEIENPT